MRGCNQGIFSHEFIVEAQDASGNLRSTGAVDDVHRVLDDSESFRAFSIAVSDFGQSSERALINPLRAC